MKKDNKLTEGQNNFFFIAFLLLTFIFSLSFFMTKNGVEITEKEKDILIMLILFCLSAAGYFIYNSINCSDKKFFK